MRHWAPDQINASAELASLAEYSSDVFARVGADMTFNYISPSCERLFLRPILRAKQHNGFMTAGCLECEGRAAIAEAQLLRALCIGTGLNHRRRPTPVGATFDPHRAVHVSGESRRFGFDEDPCWRPPPTALRGQDAIRHPNLDAFLNAEDLDPHVRQEIDAGSCQRERWHSIFRRDIVSGCRDEPSIALTANQRQPFRS